MERIYGYRDVLLAFFESRETIILDMSNLVKRKKFTQLRDQIMSMLSTTGSIIDMADWV